MFYVIEIQTSSRGSVIPFCFNDRNEAEAKYHALLTVAATSTIRKHGAMLLNDDGFIIKTEVYNHNEVTE